MSDIVNDTKREAWAHGEAGRLYAANRYKLTTRIAFPSSDTVETCEPDPPWDDIRGHRRVLSSLLAGPTARTIFLDDLEERAELTSNRELSLAVRAARQDESKVLRKALRQRAQKLAGRFGEREVIAAEIKAARRRARRLLRKHWRRVCNVAVLLTEIARDLENNNVRT